MKFIFKILIYSLLIVNFSILSISCSKKNITDPNIYGTVTDVDGNIYKTVTIGTQTWMAENLKTTKYRNGDLIETTLANDLSGESTPKYQVVYDRDEKNVAIYGRLYTWHAVTDTRSIAPTGWHVPNYREWVMLMDFLGGETRAGGQLKAKGITLWESPNLGASNSTGFSALPGGYWSGGFYQKGVTGNWWSVATPDYTTVSAYFFGLGYGFNGVTIWDYHMDYGLSVRCVKD